MLFNEEAEGKSAYISGKPPIVHRTTGAGATPFRARTLCGKNLWWFRLTIFEITGLIGLETDDDVSCMTCIAAGCR